MNSVAERFDGIRDVVAGAREGAVSNVNASDEWRATVDQNKAAVRGKKEESFDFENAGCSSRSSLRVSAATSAINQKDSLKEMEKKHSI